MYELPVLNNYSEYLRKRYGEIVYRVPLDTGMSCPHRNKDGSGGCAFCSETGSRAIQIGTLTDIQKQIHAGVAFARKRYNAQLFMAYLQAYTSTFASVERFSQLISTICKEQKFCIFSIGARPDCLSDKMLAYLQQLNEHFEVWIELGIQTIHDQTLQRINRGHDWQTSREAIIRLHNAGICTAAHLIIGLPGETLRHYRQTLDVLSELPVDAVKLHNLHVINNTPLARQYTKKPFPLISEYEYIEILLDLLPRIPAERPIMRLTTDTPDDQLLAPRWTMSKSQFLRQLLNQMKKRKIRQGSACGQHKGINENIELNDDPYLETVVTKDGSITFWNAEVKEQYHSVSGARSEAEKKYCQPARLDHRLKKGKVHVLDICFGLGYNSLVSCEYALQHGQEVEIIALEQDKRVVLSAAQEIHEEQKPLAWKDCLYTLYQEGQWKYKTCSIQLLWGDARYTVRQVGKKFDLIWLDAFSTQRNAELWTVDLFRTLHGMLKSDGALLTYCAAIPVRSAMLEAGFQVGETKPFGRDRGGTMACLDAELLPLPLPERDLFLMQTTRGIPYRDPEGTRSNREILREREMEIIQQKKQTAK